MDGSCGMCKKIAIGGTIQAGKSTLVERLLEEISLPAAGFVTKLDRDHILFSHGREQGFPVRRAGDCCQNLALKL